MRIAVVSDLHANLPAIEAVGLDIEEQRVDETWCLGDVVGYGGQPREVLAWVEKRCALTVKGNHDHAVATGDVEGFNPIAAAAARNHAQVLTPDERARLHDLPLESRRPITPGAALLVHGSPESPLHEYVYPSVARRELGRWRSLADVLFMGHTHVPFAALINPSSSAVPAWRIEGFDQAATVEDSGSGRAFLAVNPGSVGQPRDGDPRAAYVLLDDREGRVELRRVAYDVDAAASAIRAARLDPFLAQRLYRGA